MLREGKPRLTGLPSRGAARGIKAVALLGAANMLGKFTTDRMPAGAKACETAARAVVEELRGRRPLGALKLQVAHGVQVLWDAPAFREFLAITGENFTQFWSRIAPEEATSTCVAEVSAGMLIWLKSPEASKSWRPILPPANS